jgi:hypothetical protein
LVPAHAGVGETVTDVICASAFSSATSENKELNAAKVKNFDGVSKVIGSFLLNLPISFKGGEEIALWTIELNSIRQKVFADFAKRSKAKMIEKNPSELKARMLRNNNFIAILDLV